MTIPQLAIPQPSIDLSFDHLLYARVRREFILHNQVVIFHGREVRKSLRSREMLFLGNYKLDEALSTNYIAEIKVS